MGGGMLACCLFGVGDPGDRSRRLVESGLGAAVWKVEVAAAGLC